MYLGGSYFSTIYVSHFLEYKTEKSVKTIFLQSPKGIKGKMEKSLMDIQTY